MIKPDYKTLKKRQILACRNGFTLLEILVAVFILAIVMTTIFGSFNMVMGKADDINKNIDYYEMGNNCLNRIISDILALHITLRPLYRPPDFDDEPDLYRFFGEESTIDGIDFSKLQFTANAHLPLEGNTRMGVARIVYYVQKTSAELYVLRRADHLFPYGDFEENENDPVICDNVSAFSLIYYDESGGEFEYWDSDSDEFGFATPNAIKMMMNIGKPPDDIHLETMMTIPVKREKKAA